MSGQRVGYLRVSSADQSTARQLEGVSVDRVFVDKASGRSADRPQLEALVRYVREGDTVIVHSLDRLARNLDDLRRLVQSLTKAGVCVQFVTERLVFSQDKRDVQAQLLLSVLGAFSEFERALIRERQREGIALAKDRGVYKGRKKALSAIAIGAMIERVRAGESKAAVARDLNISRETLYQYLRRAEASLGATVGP